MLHGLQLRVLVDPRKYLTIGIHYPYKLALDMGAQTTNDNLSYITISFVIMHPFHTNEVEGLLNSILDPMLQFFFTNVHNKLECCPWQRNNICEEGLKGDYSSAGCWP